jgi:isopenicillin N synthase-like dioxygenase
VPSHSIQPSLTTLPLTTLPIIDAQALVNARSTPSACGAAARCLDAAARTHGFFYAVNHGVDTTLIERLVSHARTFFAQSEAAKMQIPMSAGGRAWRGYFALGGELTSNRPDWKEGLYLGSELGPEHPRVRAGTILHGANLWPPGLDGFRDTVLAYIDALTRLGHALMGGFALALGLPERWFADSGGTADPLILLRLFNYPSRPVPAGCSRCCGRTTWAACRCAPMRAGSTPRRCPAASCATSATCWIA